MSETRTVQRHEVGVNAGLNVNSGAVVLVGGLVGLGFFLYYRAKNAVKETVQETADAIDPTNPNNIFNTAAKKVAAAVTGKKPEEVSFAPEVKNTTVSADVFTMTQAQKLAWLDKEISKVKTKLAAAKTTAEKTAVNNSLKELTKRRADVAAGKP